MKASIFRARSMGAMAALMLGTFGVSAAHASYLYTFNNAASFTANDGNFDYNPTVPNFRLDYKTAAGIANHSAVFTTVNGNGAVQVTEGFSYANDGAGGNAYTIDLFPSPSPTDITNISFDIRLDPQSAKDAYGGAGYLEVTTRADNYGGTKISSFNEEFGNPTFSASTAGTYEHISIPVSGANSNVRALTISLYNDSGRNINGNVIYDIDNLLLTSVSGGPVPEPASLAMLGLAVPALLRRRRQA